MDGFRRMLLVFASIRRITSLYPPYNSSLVGGLGLKERKAKSKSHSLYGGQSMLKLDWGLYRKKSDFSGDVETILHKKPAPVPAIPARQDIARRFLGRDV